MINLPDNRTCVGCGVCQLVCPTKCITMTEDEDGFRQIHISENDCIHCNKCEHSCPIVSRRKLTNKSNAGISVFACFHKNKEIQKVSSSGGFFNALCRSFFDLHKDNASVFGAVLQRDLSVQHEEAVKYEDITKFSGSKYLQSDIRPVLRKIKSRLEEGRQVMFSGTPCQIAAVYGFLKKKYEYFYTCEVICHGVPSGYHFRCQNDRIENKYQSAIDKLNFRSKKICWPIPMTMYHLESGRDIYVRTEENSFMSAFYAALNLRESCYSCPFAAIPRVADLTMGDFWGYDQYVKFTKEEVALGVSVVLCNNDVGEKLFLQATPYLKVEKSSIDKAILGNIHLIQPVSRSVKERNNFLSDLHKITLDQLENKYFKVSFLKKMGILLGPYFMKCFFYLKNVYIRK